MVLSTLCPPKFRQFITRLLRSSNFAKAAKIASLSTMPYSGAAKVMFGRGVFNYPPVFGDPKSGPAAKSGL